MWYEDGVLVSDGAPFTGVIESELGDVPGSGTYACYEAGVLHRTDGPAVRRRDGAEEWWLDGQRVAEPSLVG